ncbi:MAG: tRNA-splicing ligase RtcB [Candidatus Heimdallarchaeota archaeon LC_2]|nr:MAG: tRNA-splicing ligase RtcB [Candidatus Heimdallarchaeota archaeon LC_2]
MKNLANKISNNVWEIPASAREGMNVPVHIYSNDNLFQSLDDGVVNQGMNVASLPGLVKKVSVMPDGHWGYGFPIGGVAAMNLEDGVISPGGIGFDINCGMRLIQTNLTLDDVKPKLKELVDEMFLAIPTGVGRKGPVRLQTHQLDDVMSGGVDWVIDEGLGWSEDKQFIEEQGQIKGARPELISEKARNRGKNQIGTLGSGNHFAEIQVVKPENVYEKETAEAFGITKENQIVIMVHCGSRGFGHQVASEYLQKFLEVMPKYGIQMRDKELAAAPIFSKEGEEYFASMACAANLAFANRSVIMHNTRKVFSKVFGQSAEDLGMHLTYDVCHNIAKFEEHMVDGKKQKLLVHRKGATRAFAPEHPDLAPKYQKFGQPVIIGGSMETGSYILAGTEASMHQAFGSSAHGSGRTMSRTKAKKIIDGKTLLKQMSKKGIYVKGASMKGLSEEAGFAYKDLDDVVLAAKDANLSKPIVKLLPIGNIKG